MFGEDFGVTFRYFVRVKTMKKKRLTFRLFLLAFGRFCEHRGRADWNPALYDPYTMLELWLSTDGFYVVEREPGEPEEMYALHYQHREDASSSRSFGDDYREQIQEFIAADRRTRSFPTFQRLLNAFGQFCIGEGYRWEPWEYSLADMHRVWDSVGGVRGTETPGGYLIYHDS
jgi:hypothetical protein